MRQDRVRRAITVRGRRDPRRRRGDRRAALGAAPHHPAGRRSARPRAPPPRRMLLRPRGPLPSPLRRGHLRGDPGSLVYLPREVPHSYQVGDTAGRKLIIGVPAGIEDFFRDLGEVDLDKLQHRHGVTFRPAAAPTAPGCPSDKIAAATARLARGEAPTQVAKALGVSGPPSTVTPTSPPPAPSTEPLTTSKGPWRCSCGRWTLHPIQAEPQPGHRPTPPSGHRRATGPVVG